MPCPSLPTRWRMLGSLTWTCQSVPVYWPSRSTNRSPTCNSTTAPVSEASSTLGLTSVPAPGEGAGAGAPRLPCGPGGGLVVGGSAPPGAIWLTTPMAVPTATTLVTTVVTLPPRGEQSGVGELAFELVPLTAARGPQPTSATSSTDVPTTRRGANIMARLSVTPNQRETFPFPSAPVRRGCGPARTTAHGTAAAR